MLALIFFIAFPFLLWKAVQTHQTAKASVNWPTAEGKITKVERFKRLFRWLPRVGYSYSVGEKSYNSERISFVAGYRPKEVDEILNRYTVGQTVPVYYPPEKPGDAVLQPGSNKQVTAPIRILTICFVILLVLNVAQFFLKRATEQQNQRRTYGTESSR